MNNTHMNLKRTVNHRKKMTVMGCRRPFTLEMKKISTLRQSKDCSKSKTNSLF